MLRYGRPMPDYSASSDATVVVRMSDAAADIDFLKLVIDRENPRKNMPVDSLIILSRLKEERRLKTSDFIESIQKPESLVRSALEKLLEQGFIESHGGGRGRTYTLSAALYRRAGKKNEYIRQAGFGSIQQEQMVLQYIGAHGSINRSAVMELCHLSKDQAYKLLNKLRKKRVISMEGSRRHAIYKKTQLDL